MRQRGHLGGAGVAGLGRVWTGNPRCPCGANRDSVKHQPALLLLPVSMMACVGAPGGAGAHRPGPRATTSAPLERFPACILNTSSFFSKCRYGHVTLLVQACHVSTTHWKQNLHSSCWFRRPSPFVRAPPPPAAVLTSLSPGGA